MRRLELRPFEEEHLAAAGSLLAVRHREHRAAEPLLSQRFEVGGAAREEVAALWAEERASGAVALREGEVAGFLLGRRRDDQTWGANVWVEAAGYAAVEPALIRDLYAFAAQRWVDDGRTRHYALVPARDDHVEQWFRLSFGAQQAHGLKEVHAQEWPPGTRPAGAGDIDALLELAPLVSDQHAIAPVFSGIGWDADDDELREMLAGYVADSEVGELVYESDGRIVAAFELVRTEKALMHHGLAQPDRAVCIDWAATRPDVRGSGAGVALSGAASAWAHEHGYASLVTDWRETNLLSSRFWPARGFRRSFLRLYRSIP